MCSSNSYRPYLSRRAPLPKMKMILRPLKMIMIGPCLSMQLGIDPTLLIKSLDLVAQPRPLPVGALRRILLRPRRPPCILLSTSTMAQCRPLRATLFLRGPNLGLTKSKKQLSWTQLWAHPRSTPGPTQPALSPTPLLCWTPTPRSFRFIRIQALLNQSMSLLTRFL